MGIETAIILAGGLGTRLRPLTDETPKPLIDVQGKPLSEHVLDFLKKFGVKQVYFSVSYKSEKIMEYFKDGRDFGLKIDYLIEKEAMGTAGPLLLLRSQGKMPKNDFVMINGDNLFDLDLEKQYHMHKANNAVVTIALTFVEDPSAFGVVSLQGNHILQFVEKPKKEDAPSNYINSGYYILSPSVFDYLPGKNFAMVERDVFPKVAEDGKLLGYKDPGQWFDTGTLEQLEKVRKEWNGV